MQSRREFLRDVAVAETVGYVGLRPRPASAKPPPETTKTRLTQSPIICVAPQYLCGARLI